ncbi:MAG TPA: histidine phosphatase family protein, partial [Promineifilum sp.]|nr:histidine phosphatase family protein [Promineifilum sp.]
WAVRGTDLCHTHHRNPPLPPPPGWDDLSLLEEEVRRLLEARAEFQAWAREQRAAGGTGELSPLQFLKAWGDASARLVQLIRARREMAPREDALEELAEAVWRDLLARHGGDDRVALVIHGGFFRALFNVLVDAPHDRPSPLGLKGWWIAMNNASITRIDFDEEAGERWAAIVYVNKVEHLTDDLLSY